MKTLTIILTAITITCKAQLFITGQGGFNMPIGDFKSTEYRNKNCGYAYNGFYGKVEAGYMFNKYIGIGAAVNYTSNGADIANKTFGSYTGPYGTYTNRSYESVTSFHYTSVNPMLGVIVNVPINDKNNIGVKALSGWSVMNIPEVTISDLAYFGGKQDYTQKALTLQNICYQGELFYQRNITEYFMIGLNASLFYCKYPTYSALHTTTVYYNGTARAGGAYKNTENLTISTVLTGLSATYKF